MVSVFIWLDILLSSGASWDSRGVMILPVHKTTCCKLSRSQERDERRLWCYSWGKWGCIHTSHVRFNLTRVFFCLGSSVHLGRCESAIELWSRPKTQILVCLKNKSFLMFDVNSGAVWMHIWMPSESEVASNLPKVENSLQLRAFWVTNQKLNSFTWRV